VALESAVKACKEAKNMDHTASATSVSAGAADTGAADAGAGDVGSRTPRRPLPRPLRAMSSHQWEPLFAEAAGALAARCLEANAFPRNDPDLEFRKLGLAAMMAVAAPALREGCRRAAETRDLSLQLENMLAMDTAKLRKMLGVHRGDQVGMVMIHVVPLYVRSLWCSKMLELALEGSPATSRTRMWMGQLEPLLADHEATILNLVEWQDVWLLLYTSVHALDAAMVADNLAPVWLEELPMALWATEMWAPYNDMPTALPFRYPAISTAST